MRRNGFRTACEKDIECIAEIYDKIHTEEEQGRFTIGWKRGIYPIKDTALAALEQSELFVYEEEGCILGSAIINHTQNDVYSKGHWRYHAEGNRIMVLHTLAVNPEEGRKGVGGRFINFYESLAREKHCQVLRLDTSKTNSLARRMYAKHGYTEAGIVPCEFNGIGNVELVLLEKSLKEV